MCCAAAAAAAAAATTTARRCSSCGPPAGKRILYRHFVRRADGAILELFGPIDFLQTDQYREVESEILGEKRCMRALITPRDVCARGSSDAAAEPPRLFRRNSVGDAACEMRSRAARDRLLGAHISSSQTSAP